MKKSQIVKNSILICVCAILVFGLISCKKGTDENTQDQQDSPAQKQERPPEYDRLRAALRIEDLNARIAELEAIKKEFPDSQYLGTIDANILGAKVNLSSSVDAILALQKPVLESEEGLNKLSSYYSFSEAILNHEKLAQFDRAKVTQAVTDYVHEGLTLSQDENFINSIPEDRRQRLNSYIPMLHLVLARAYLNENRAEDSNQALKNYLDKGGSRDPVFYYYQAVTLEKMGEIQNAFESYFAAAVDNYRDSLEKAKELYNKIHGSLEGFETELDAKLRELPFHPEHFVPEGEWSGKAVLAELFTGSECPPCVAADLGFDGLIDAYDSRYLAILEYHLHIPRPDPMVNPATLQRAAYYGVRSTPSTFFDGENKYGGGGNRSRAEAKFDQYSGEINSRISAVPEVQLKLSAVLDGSLVKVNFEADKILENADFNVVLVQGEESYTGANGIAFHKMVVRDFKTVGAAQSGQVEFDVAEMERAGQQHLADFEQENSFEFREKHFKLDASNLRVVFFVQNHETKEVLNAVSTTVK